ncbi:MAG: thiol protease/hemagglutinin PrtT [Bacteroidales bacterium]|nr:thiol protease/hemagglutinin PrtT [Bacteroidales bacterium]
MKKSFLFLVSVFILTNMAWASPVDSMEAKNLAQTFYRLHFPGQALPVFEEISQSVGVEHFYIFNNTSGPGFVLVAGDDCATPILGYSGANNCQSGELPDNLRSWFNYYDGTIAASVLNGAVATPEIAEEWNNLRTGNLPEPQSVTAVSPLLATTWNQIAPYNDLCPGTGSDKPYVGCVATAMAQLMKYYNWPTTGTGSYSYYCNNGTYNYGILSANFGTTTYDWANMLNSYPNTNSGTAAQRTAVATLMYHCGVSVNMSYSPEWSGAFLADCEVASTYPNYPTAEKALKNYFKYSPSLVGAARANYTNTQWIAMLKNDLDQQRPVLYDGTAQNGQGGHCFVCDGYDNFNNFHFNWGWEGNYDGYFVLDNLTPGTGQAGAGSGDFSYNQSALFGVVPNNGSTPDPSGCAYLHYPLPGTLNFYTFNNNGGYVAGTNIYGETAKADYFTYSGSGSVQSLNVTFGAIDGVNGSINFTVWADNNGTPGAVLGSKTVTLNTIYTTAVNLGGNYECVFDNPIAVNGSFFAGIDFSNASSAIGIYTTTAGDTANTGWSLSSSGQWVPYNSPSHVNANLTHAIHPYVCATSTPTPPDPTGCNYLHYPLATTTTYTVNGGGYVSGTNVYGDEAKADYFTYSGNGSVEKIKITIGAIDGTNGSVAFTVWADNNGTPGAVLGSKTVTLSTIYSAAASNNGDYECVFDSPIAVSGSFFAGLDISNATSYFGLVSTVDSTAANTAWDYYDGDWWPYTDSWELSVTNAIFPYVCSGSDPNPPTPTTDLNVYSNFTYTPNPMQQNQSVSVEVSVANTGSSAYNGTLKLVLLDANNIEQQVIGQSNITLNSMSFFNFQFSGTVTVPVGTYQMAVFAQPTGQSTWTLVGNGLNYPNPVSVTVTGGSNPPVSAFNLIMYEDFTYTPNPMQQNQTVTVSATVANSGTGAFNGNLKLVLLDANNFEAQTIGQTSGSLNTMTYNAFQFSNTVTVNPGTYNLALYYQATGESTWTLVGSGFGHDNPVAVTVTGGSTPPVNEFNLVMYEAFSYTPNPMQENQTVTVSASVANAGSGNFTGTVKLALLNANNMEVLALGQQSGTISTMTYTPLQFSGTITVPAGTYQLALLYQATGESTWTLVGNDLGVDNPVSVTVTGGSTPPVNNVDLNMYTDFLYTPNPLKQNTMAYVSASIINMGSTAFTGSLRLALETENEELVQTIQQINVSTPLAANGNATYNFSGTITAEPGFYNLILYYKPDGATNWTAVGSNYNASFQNPKSVIVTYPDGIDDHSLETAKLRPNPATDHFYLDVDAQNLDKVEILSSTGQIVLSQKNVLSSESIDISGLSSGVYFVRYEASRRIGTLKLIVQ